MLVHQPSNSEGKLTSEGHGFLRHGTEVLENPSSSLGVVILSGGQGSRLREPGADSSMNCNLPKGCIEINQVPLFNYHIDRLRKITKHARAKIFLFIMTSLSTDQAVSDFFASTSDMGFLEGIEIFQQSEIPTRGENWELIFRESDPSGNPNPSTGETTFQNSLPYVQDISGEVLNLAVVTNPLGNGDVFDSLKKCRNYAKVDCFNIFSVDNVLANILDPVFVGAFYSNRYDVLSKAIKANDGEKVGSFQEQNGKIVIEEYSSKGADSDLWGNICNHLFSRDFIDRIDSDKMELHLAYKKEKYDYYANVDASEVEAVKLEKFDEGSMAKILDFVLEHKIERVECPEDCGTVIKRERFIFDCFKMAEKCGILAVAREEEFSPIKNNSLAKTDNMATCSKAALEKRQETIEYYRK